MFNPCLKIMFFHQGKDLGSSLFLLAKAFLWLILGKQRALIELKQSRKFWKPAGNLDSFRFILS